MDLSGPPLGTWVERQAGVRPEGTALEIGRERFAYEELARLVERTASSLASLGVGPGDRVGFSGAAGLAYLTTLFATTLLGAAFTPINPRLDPEIALFILRDSGPRLVVRDPTSVLDATMAAGSEPTFISLDATSRERDVSWPHQGPFSAPRRTPALTELALLPYTSGTTGRPKGVMLSHANLLANALNMTSVVDFRSTDRVLVAASLYRMGGLSIALHALFAGATLLIPGSTDPGAVLGELVDRTATILFTGPEQLRSISDEHRFAAADLRSLRLAFTGGSPVLGALAQRYAERSIPVVQGYGLTEASPLILFCSAEETARGLGTAGAPPALVEVRVVDDAGNDASDGAVGELIARGPNVSAGYWHDPDATARTFRHGCLHTGDAASRSANGDIRILGRLGDLVLVAGGAVTTGQIERALEQVPGIAEIVGFGLPSGEWSVPAAAVVPAPGATLDHNALEAQLRSAGPAFGGARVFLVGAIPKSPAGKPRRGELQERFAPA